MDALDLLLLRYDDVHVGFVDELFKGLDDEQVRRRPGGMNSIAWLVWHFTRVQDAAVSRFVADRPQVLDEGRWNEAMGLDRRDVGSGMTGEEVDAMSAAVDPRGDLLRRCPARPDRRLGRGRHEGVARAVTSSRRWRPAGPASSVG